METFEEEPPSATSQSFKDIIKQSSLSTDDINRINANNMTKEHARAIERFLRENSAIIVFQVSKEFTESLKKQFSLRLYDETHDEFIVVTCKSEASDNGNLGYMDRVLQCLKDEDSFNTTQQEKSEIDYVIKIN